MACQGYDYFETGKVRNYKHLQCRADCVLRHVDRQHAIFNIALYSD